MNSVAAKTSTPADQVIAQFVGQLSEKYQKLESLEVGESTKPENSEHAHEYKSQTVAPWDGTSPIDPTKFFQVRYLELKVGGFSFWVDQPPSEPFFVVVFDKPEGAVMLKARVIEARPDSTLGNEMYLVETEFAGAIQ